MSVEEVEKHLKEVVGWAVLDGKIEKIFSFPAYLDGLAFVKKAAELAEEQDHHPDLLLTWRKVKITLWTHVVDGLSINDFIYAAKLDRIAV